MLVLGIDPGIAITGFGLVQVNLAGDLSVISFGVIDFNGCEDYLQPFGLPL